MTTTNNQYDAAVHACRDIFLKKTADYGTSWRVLRPISIVDQIYIKAKRIRTLQEKGVQEVNEGIKDEFKGIVNYGVIGLIQISLENEEVEEFPVSQVQELFDEKIGMVKGLMGKKNHDYGEAWRDMSQESFTDLILMKLMRTKQILRNDGHTIISEGIDANYIDIINYSIFALIMIAEGKHKG